MNVHSSGGPQAGRFYLQLLGDFAVFDDGSRMLLRQCGQRVLAFLALSQRPVTRARIAGTLWPVSATPQALANLRATLTRMPRSGGRSLVRAGHTDLSLAEHVMVDVQLCDQQMRDLRASGGAGSGAGSAAPAPAGFAPATETFLSLLASDVLPFWEDDWVLIERERHRQARLHALERLSQQLRESGRLEEALEAALAAAAGEPLRESAHRRIIDVHLEEGNASEALRQYESYRHLLWQELGLRPSDTIRQLVRPLLGRPGDVPDRSHPPRPRHDESGRGRRPRP